MFTPKSKTKIEDLTDVLAEKSKNVKVVAYMPNCQWRKCMLGDKLNKLGWWSFAMTCGLIIIFYRKYESFKFWFLFFL